MNTVVTTATATARVAKLTPNTSHKSFYGKAIVIFDGSAIKLQSYFTNTDTIDTDNNILYTGGTYSRTTSRHQRAFYAEYSHLFDRVICKHTGKDLDIKKFNI